MTTATTTREAQAKASLLHTWNTLKLQRLEGWVESLSPKDLDLLLEALGVDVEVTQDLETVPRSASPCAKTRQGAFH